VLSCLSLSLSLSLSFSVVFFHMYCLCHGLDMVWVYCPRDPALGAYSSGWWWWEMVALWEVGPSGKSQEYKGSLFLPSGLLTCSLTHKPQHDTIWDDTGRGPSPEPMPHCWDFQPPKLELN
jgi:hypothetical protein